MKNILARAALRWYLPRFQSDPHPFNRLLGRAASMQFGRLSEEEFRAQLDAFYAGLDIDSTRRDLNFADKIKRLDVPGGYKVDVSRLYEGGKDPGPPGRFDIWGRRFGLLRRIGVRSDVLILRLGETIPPHGHHRVVSGFFVLDGRVAIRHYDRIKECGDTLLVRQSLDANLGPGGFTTNSEFHHNIHWLQGLDERSYLFRVTVTDTPTRTFSPGDASNSRVYIDPTGEPDALGQIRARYVSEQAAKELSIR
jgi:hypothetical protein